ncbi:hypothetical protein CO683_13245 [Bradyrhizobium ottawaense]|uniref:oxygenase MpaB family protein n=1 Tax=Bradyrhizobium TaxID=374 RepID=UPI000BEA9310|nr:hypothetical protein CO683_13245 [Bradyrhizobium ottawaense]
MAVHDLILPPFSVEKRERYWAKSRLFGAIFGLTSSELPTHWDSFAAYNAAMMQSDTLSVGTAAREVAQDLRRFTTMLRPPRLVSNPECRTTAGPITHRLRVCARRTRQRGRRACSCPNTTHLSQNADRLRYVGPY